MAKQLLAAKADLSFVDRCGRGAVDIAFDQEMREILTPSPKAEEEEGEGA